MSSSVNTNSTSEQEDESEDVKPFPPLGETMSQFTHLENLAFNSGLEGTIVRNIALLSNWL